MQTLARRIAIIVAAAACASVLGATARADAVVLVTEDGGFEPETVRTLRSLLSTDLRARGIPVVEDARFTEPRPLDSATRAAVVESRADRLFVLRLGRLDKKVVLSLEELVPDTLLPVETASLSAETIDEADTVLVRLVRSVVEHEPVEKGARIATVTAQESEPFKKKPGEGLFVLGVGLAPIGGSIGWSYEARFWRLGVLFQGADDDVSFFGVEGAWIPFDTEISPYLGVGLGVVGPEDDGDGVVGTKLEAGVEFFRLHGVRLIAGVNAVIPFESRPGTDSVNFGLHIRAGF
jgi:hypothetical protein